MSESWKLVLPCDRAEADKCSGDPGLPDRLGDDVVLTARESRPGTDLGWDIEIFCVQKKPGRSKILAIGAALPVVLGDRRMTIEAVAPRNWVAESQAGIAPITIGRFHIHTSAHPPSEQTGIRNLLIDASQAFGTGHHPTTHGCLAALTALHAAGLRPRRIVDIGTGTGVLAFAALHLWPAARVAASDIDPVAIATARRCATANGIGLGPGPGRVFITAGAGTAARAIQRQAPYDLVIANILSGPLISLAPALGSITAPGGVILLAGLMAEQARAVTGAYRRQGFRARSHSGSDPGWPVLHLVAGPRVRRRTRGNSDAGDCGTGEL